jgi:hypothetical protein
MARHPPPENARNAEAAPVPPRHHRDRWRQDNVGRLLNNAVSRFESRVLDLMSRSGHPQARISHVSLTRNLDRGGLAYLSSRAERA